MSGTGRLAGPPGCGHEAAAYVLGALEPAQARAFARHLERCATCRNEVDALAPVLEALPASAPPYRVSRGLRRRVLRAARAERKHAVRAPPRRVSLRMPSLSARPGVGLALGLAFAVALAVPLRPTAPDERTIHATAGRAELRAAGGQGELIVDHLPALADDRTYELWLVNRARQPVPSTLFAVTSGGTADLGVPGDLHALRSLLVTVEPRGGSLVPTSRAVIQLPLDSVSRSSPT